MKNIRKVIRKELFKLLENYPASTVNDPSAPWNQSDPKFLEPKVPGSNLFVAIYFNNEITILKNTQDNSKWFFYNDSVEKNDYLPYSGAEDESVFLGKDDDGPIFDEKYNWELNGPIVQDYINDNLENLSQGEGVKGYEDGIDLVKIDEPLIVALTGLYRDPKLQEVLLKA